MKMKEKKRSNSRQQRHQPKIIGKKHTKLT